MWGKHFFPPQEQSASERHKRLWKFLKKETRKKKKTKTKIRQIRAEIRFFSSVINFSGSHSRCATWRLVWHQRCLAQGHLLRALRDEGEMSHLSPPFCLQPDSVARPPQGHWGGTDALTVSRCCSDSDEAVSGGSRPLRPPPSPLGPRTDTCVSA